MAKMRRKKSEQVRTRPDHAIRQVLRAEVNYGCPVKDCGNPYLSYHHFDPPWEIGHVHNPPGMIALCLGHHKMADAPTRAWTNDQLRAMKINPFLALGAPVQQSIEMRRKEVFLDCGGSLAIRPSRWLQVEGRDLVWITEDRDGNKLLNLDIRNNKGDQLLRMDNNDWTAYGPFGDLEAIPSASSIDVSAAGGAVRLHLRFRHVEESSFAMKYSSVLNIVASQVPVHAGELFKPTVRSVSWMRTMGLKWPAMLVTLRGHLVYPAIVHMRDSEYVLERNKTIVFNRCVVAGMGFNLTSDALRSI